jgi:hypothetical protein
MDRMKFLKLLFAFMACAPGLLYLTNGSATLLAQALFRLALMVVGCVGLVAVMVVEKRRG